MTPARRCPPCWAIGLLPGLLYGLMLMPSGAALAAGAAATASAVVLVPVSVNAWLGVPVSVLELLLAQDAPPGPATGALVPRVASPTTSALLRPLPVWVATAVEGRQAFGVDIVPAAGTALLARGPAAAVSVASGSAGVPGGNVGEADGPLVITVAFN